MGYFPKIKKKFLYRDRWYINLETPVNGQTFLPYSHYVWLLGNPAFESIPKGYLVHHLDGDKHNDDISNLVIMHKHHHMGHHFKSFKLSSEVKFNGEFVNIFGRNASVPKLWEHKKLSRWEIYWFEDGPDGKKKRKRMYSYDNIPFKEEEYAKLIYAKIIGSFGLSD
jgi:hypothetical protein